MNIDWTISIGSVLSGVLSGLIMLFGLYGAAMRFWHAADKRITSAESALQGHSATLVEHSRKMENHEKRMVDVIQDVAGILGALNRDNHSQGWTGQERRRSPQT